MSRIFCTSCGKELEEGSSFCTECGAQVEAPKPAEAVIAAEPTPEAAETPAEAVIAAEPTPEAAETPAEAVIAAEPTPKAAETPAEAASTPKPVTPLPAASLKPTKSQRMESEKPPKRSPYSPMGAWAYFWTDLAMCIPVLGLILAIVWACGGCRSISRRNFARYYWIKALIALILAVIVVIVLAVIIVSSGGSFNINSLLEYIQGLIPGLPVE